MKTQRLVCALACAVVLLSALTAAADDFKPYPAPLEGKKIAIFLDNQYQIDEAYYTPLRLKEAGADVKIVSHYSPEVTRDTHSVKTDITPKEARSMKWDGTVVIGGFSPLEMREDDDVVSIIRSVYDKGGMTAAICHGVCALVTADVLKGKTITGNVPRSIEFTNAGANYVAEAPQVDDNIVTAIGPADNGPYLDAMINWFNGGEENAKAHYYDQYLKGKKVAILIDRRFDYDQVKYPYVRLTHNGADVIFVASEEGEYNEYRGVGGDIRVDMKAQDAMQERFDAILLVSHWAADTYRRNADVRQFVKRHLDRGTCIASLNWGHTVLIEANACTGREFATTPGMHNDIANAGGKPIAASIHRDGNLLTAARDSDLPELMRYMVGYMTSVK